MAPAIAARIARAERDGADAIPVGNLTPAPRRHRRARRGAGLPAARSSGATPGEVYNVCTGQDLAVQELADRLVGLATPPARARAATPRCCARSTCPCSGATPPSCAPPPAGSPRSPSSRPSPTCSTTCAPVCGPRRRPRWRHRDPTRALITGITGQDGSYLAELLLDKGYEVVGMVRRSSTTNFERIAHLQDRLMLDPYTSSGDLLDEASLIAILREYRPHEVYNLAAAVVRADVVQPAGAHRRDHRPRRHPAARRHPHRRPDDPLLPGELERDVRQGAGGAADRDARPFYPRSPYGVAKLYGHWITVNYRESYDLHASSAASSSTTSRPRRGLEFLPRKVSHGVAKIKLGPGRRSCRSATSTPSATGASPATTSRRCG